MHHLTVKNWAKFQHYKDRDPPWIKLHKSLLDDYDFCCLQDASKLHLILIWLYAARNDGQIPNDPKFVQKKLGLSASPDLKALIAKGFLVDASNTLADCEQSAIPETETETYTQETEKRGASRFSPPTLDEVKAYCADRKNHVNPETFVDFYAAKGWKVGNQPMKDWKAAVRTWEKREQFTPKNGNGSVPPITDERGLESYGAKFGIRPRAGESWAQFRSRVVQAAP